MRCRWFREAQRVGVSNDLTTQAAVVGLAAVANGVPDLLKQLALRLGGLGCHSVIQPIHYVLYIWGGCAMIGTIAPSAAAARSAGHTAGRFFFVQITHYPSRVTLTTRVGTFQLTPLCRNANLWYDSQW